jgi:phosphoglycolate phosphatase-like HAD superfamily hydrolase
MKDQKMKAKTIIFDLDGTIFDITERDAFARYKALNELGHSVSLHDVKQCYRSGIRRLGLVERTRALAEQLGIDFTEREEQEYVKTTFAYFIGREAASLTKIHKGVYEALSTLYRRFELIIVTSRDSLSSTEQELGGFGVRKFFTLVVTREVAAKYCRVKEILLLPFQEQRKKLYKCAIGLMKIHPADVLCIGDSVDKVEPAKKLGIKTIGVLTGFSSKEDMEKASIRTVRDLTDLVKILNYSNKPLP